MFKNNLHVVFAGIVICSIVLFLIFRPEPKFTVFEKKVGEIVYAKDFKLKVLEVNSGMDGLTRIDLVIRNLSDKPIKFLVTDRSDKSNDLGYKKYYFIVELNKRNYLTCCANHLVDPGDESGKSDYEFEIYFSGYITPSDNYFLLVAEDPLGEDVVSKIKLTTNQKE